MYDNYEEVTIESNSVPIVLSLWKSRKEDPCIIFFPGTMTHPLFYEPFLKLLATHDFNVIGIHPVSHGKSPRVKKQFGFDDMLQNGKDAISYALNRFNEMIFFMGSSQGGILAIALSGLDHRIRAVIPHNILIPQFPESISVTRYPVFLKPLYKPVIAGIRLMSRVFPGVQIPVQFYLDLNRVSSDKQMIEKLKTDPIGFMSYPLYFLSSLFNADLHQIQDGSIQCPVIVIAARHDPLFPLEYTKYVFEAIKAPYKELLILEENVHLIFNERVETVIAPIVVKIKALARELTKSK